MSKITNDGLTRSATGCFVAVPIRQQWATGRQGVNKNHSAVDIEKSLVISGRHKATITVESAACG